MPMLRRSPVLAAALALACPTLPSMSACAGDDAGGDEDDDDDDDGDSGPGDPEAAAQIAMAAEARPAPLVDEQLKLCVGVADAASQLAGRVTFTGTVDVRGSDPSYSPSPADALVLRTPGFDQRFEIERMQFGGVANVSEVFVTNHDIACRTSRDDAFELEMSSSLSGRSGSRSAEGTVEDLGRTVSFSLEEASTTDAEVDGNLAQYESNTSRTGTATGDALEVSWREAERYLVLVSSEAFENRTTEITFDAEVDGFSFAMDEGVIKRSFRNALADEPDFWAQTGGTLTRDGDVAGTLAFRRGASGTFEIVLSTDGGDEVLESYAP